MTYMTDATLKRAPVPPSPRRGIGFCGLLTILFIGLKLTGVVSWSWWLVLSPMWIGYALVLLIVGVCLLAAAMLS